jgi:hypothetical protein
MRVTASKMRRTRGTMTPLDAERPELPVALRRTRVFVVRSRQELVETADGGRRGGHTAARSEELVPERPKAQVDESW